MKYKGKKIFEVQHGWFDEMQCAVEIDFDYPEIMDRIKVMVEFWSGWEGRLENNDSDYVKTFLQQCGSWTQSKSLQGYSDIGVVSELSENEGWFPVNGSQGINITRINTIEFEDDEFEVKELEIIQK